MFKWPSILQFPHLGSHIKSCSLWFQNKHLPVSSSNHGFVFVALSDDLSSVSTILSPHCNQMMSGFQGHN